MLLIYVLAQSSKNKATLIPNVVSSMMFNTTWILLAPLFPRRGLLYHPRSTLLHGKIFNIFLRTKPNGKVRPCGIIDSWMLRQFRTDSIHIIQDCALLTQTVVFSRPCLCSSRGYSTDSNLHTFYTLRVHTDGFWRVQCDANLPEICPLLLVYLHNILRAISTDTKHLA